jgi:fucose 4-O-acetylase-like acetyltransferase
MAVAEAFTQSVRAPRVVQSVRSARRLEYLDSLKLVLTVLVIAHHAGQPYGPTGGRWPIFDPQRAAILGPFFAVNAAFFMGLFFMISAYFVPTSFERKGVWSFLKDRFIRLGIPFIVVGLAIGAASNTTFDPAHMWFVAHLLVYAVLYAAWRTFRPAAITLPTPGNRAILGYAFVLAGLTAVVRMNGFPQDRWVTIFGVLPIEVAHLPQYASLFAFGLLAARGNWFATLPTRTGMIWLLIGIGLGIARYAYTPSSVLWSVWESFICVGLCVGIPVFFRELLSSESRIVKALAANAFGAYVVHVLPVVVGIQMALAEVSLDPLTKFALVTLLGVPLSFLLAAGLRRLPGVRAVL